MAVQVSLCWTWSETLKTGFLVTRLKLFWFLAALQFSPGIKRLYAEIEINYDNERENSEVFSVHLSQDRFMVAEVKVRIHPMPLAMFINLFSC